MLAAQLYYWRKHIERVKKRRGPETTWEKKDREREEEREKDRHRERENKRVLANYPSALPVSGCHQFTSHDSKPSLIFQPS